MILSGDVFSLVFFFSFSFFFCVIDRSALTLICRSTTHRVYNLSEKERYSIPLFIGPNYCTEIAPIHTCVSETRPARHEPFVAGAVSAFHIPLFSFHTDMP